MNIYLINLLPIALFGTYCLWENIKINKAISVILPKGIKYQYKRLTVIKAHLFNKKHWINEIKDNHRGIFIQVNILWRTFVLKIGIAFLIYVVLKLLIGCFSLINEN